MAQPSPRLEYEANAISPIEHEMPILRIATPIDTTVRGTLEEEIQQGNVRLQELEKEKVQLRKKSSLIEAEVKKLEDKIKEDFLDKNTRVIKQGVHDHGDKFEDYCSELISLMP